MRTILLLWILIIGSLSYSSCKKSSNTISNSQFIGKWVWVSQNIGNTVLLDSLNSAVRRTLLFKSNGTIIVTHNDSTISGGVLQVIPNPVIFPSAVSDTGKFQISLQGDGCVNLDFQSLSLTRGGAGYDLGSYQYTLSDDTLSISNAPCLAPYSVIYIKAN